MTPKPRASSGGSPLISATVLGTDMLVGEFRCHEIADLLPAAGSCRIGGEYLGGSEAMLRPDSATRNAEMTWDGDFYQCGAGLNFPTTFGGASHGANGILAENFSVSSVPEPAATSPALAGAAILGLLATRRRKPTQG